MNRLALPLYIAFTALVGLILAALWLGPGPLAQWRQWQAPSPQAPNFDDARASALRPNPAATAQDPLVLERPLFYPSRRAQAPASAASSAVAAPPPPPPSPIEQAKLQGIVAGPLLTGVMLLEDGKTRFVRTGEQVGDWTLRAVQGREALFERAGQQRRIELSLLPTAAPTEPPPSAASGNRPQAAPRPSGAKP